MPTSENSFHIVITGGPSAGKTSALNYLYEHLAPLGWKVILVPDITALVNASSQLLPREKENKEYNLLVQKAIIKLQTKMPAMLSSVLTGNEEKVVFLYEKAELDVRASLPDYIFQRFLKKATGKDIWEVAKKYDAVFHLVTGIGKDELDKKTQQAWLGHSHFKVIGNEGDFDYKMRRTLIAVLQVLGEPEPVEIEKKWAVLGTPDISSLNSIPVSITQIYLEEAKETGEELRLRARTVQDTTTYYKTIKKPTNDPRVKIEEEVIISYETYQSLLKFQARGTRPIVKTRWCFVYNNQFFELDHIQSPIDIWLLESELLAKDDWIELPHHIGTLIDVIGNKTFSNKSIARGVKQDLPPPPYEAL